MKEEEPKAFTDTWDENEYVEPNFYRTNFGVGG
jgi:hypothetical protein